MTARALSAVLLAAVLWALCFDGEARAVDRTFAGSVQVDYHGSFDRRRADQNAFDGATIEAGIKLAIDVSEHFSGNFKLCFGCHGFETDMAHIDYRVADELNIRLGRFSPSFGNFNLRHDPANHKLSDKPLVYDMGRMLRMRDWNMGVMPSPFPDNGLELSGTHWFGASVQLDYAAHVVSGFKGDKNGMDLDFVASRSGSLYYVDNNSRPAGGGRVGLGFRLGPRSELTFGASGIYGTYDPDNDLEYLVLGGDAALRLGRTNVRAEFLLRRQTFDAGDPRRFRYALVDRFFTKQGALLELEQPLGAGFELLARLDWMERKGNVLAGSTLAAESNILRATLGTSIDVERGFRIKLSGEYWRFTPGDPTSALSFHVGATGAL